MMSVRSTAARRAAGVSRVLRAGWSLVPRRGTPAVGLVLSVALLLLPPGWAAFTGSAGNPASSFGAGTVTLSDNDSSDTLKLFNLTGLLPGDTSTGCVKVTYGGTLPATVKLYSTTGGTGLGAYLDLTVTRGTIAGAVSVPSCTGFVADAIDYKGAGAGVLYNGTLGAYPATAAAGQQDLHNAAGLAEAWTTNEVHAYKFVATLQNNVAAQGLTSSPVFGWAADNTTTYAQVIQSDDPVRYWKLDEAAGVTATDAIGAGNGTYTNGPVVNQTSGVKDANTAPRFDGVDDNVAIPTFALNSRSFTIETWLTPDTTSTPTQQQWFNAHTASATDQSLHLRLYSTGQVGFQFFSDDLNSATGVFPFTGKPVQVVCTYDQPGDTSRIYVNGQPITSGSQGPFTGTSPNIKIGIGPISGNEPFKGLIDEFAVYYSALSAQQVLEHYNAGKL